MGVKGGGLTSENDIPAVAVKLPLVASDDLSDGAGNTKPLAQVWHQLAGIVRLHKPGALGDLPSGGRGTSQKPTACRVDKVVIHLVSVGRRPNPGRQRAHDQVLVRRTGGEIWARE